MESHLDELFKIFPQPHLRFFYILDYFEYNVKSLFVYNCFYGKVVRMIFDLYKVIGLTKEQE
jgi:hypothetical protein